MGIWKLYGGLEHQRVSDSVLLFSVQPLLCSCGNEADSILIFYTRRHLGRNECGKVESLKGKTAETGPEIFIRRPAWTKENPKQDIPILIFPLKQWDDIRREKFHIGAPPVGPSELDRNAQYGFALPARSRYNFAYLTGSKEVDDLIRSGAAKAADYIQPTILVSIDTAQQNRAGIPPALYCVFKFTRSASVQ
ncbi:MAG: hypothetical protein ACFWTN_10800 [Clostridium sp.]|jgi:hypothetical protein